MALLSLTALAGASTRLSLVEMNATDGIVFVGEKTPVELFTSPSGLSIGVYSQACGFSTNGVLTQLPQIDALLSPSSLAESALSKLDPSLNGKLIQWIQANKITLLVTALGTGREIYSSFFIHQMPGLGTPAIVLDCSADLRAYWGPSLAHELTHAWLHFHSQGAFPPWLDEMYAQLVENQAHGARPEKRIGKIKPIFGRQGGSSWRTPPGSCAD